MTHGTDDVLPRLLLLTDRSQLHLSRSLTRTLQECVAAGATHVVVRELDESPESRAALVRAVVEAGGTAIAAHEPLPGAAAVHLAAGGEATGGLFGRSCHTRADVEAATAEGAAWATLGPFAETVSKPGHPPIARSAYADLPIPTFALGGITADNAADALAAGAYGVAVMGEVMRAEEPALVVKRLLEVLA